MWVSWFYWFRNCFTLLLNAVNQGRLTIEDIINKYHQNPKKILGLNENYGDDSYIEINIDKENVIRDEYLVTKAGWTPLNGVKVKEVLKE